MIEIIEANKKHIGDIAQCDGTYIVTRELVLHLTDRVLSYSIINVNPYEKKYSDPSADNVGLHEKSDIIFLAYRDSELAGQVSISRHWNNFAHINNLVVDHRVRRSGVGKKLVLRAIEWSVEQSLAGLMLETQTNNVPACELYESCGFALKGFDGSLYVGLGNGNNEIALFWYWIRPKDA